VITGQPNCPTGVVYEGYKNRLIPERDRVGQIDVVRVWTYVAPNAGIVRRTLNYLTYMVSAVMAGWFQPRPDVIVATSPQFFCGWAGILLGWLRWRPVVLEIRDVWPASIEAVGAMRNRPTLTMLELLEKWMYLAARHIVTVGEGYKAHVLERMRGRHAGRISVITNGVDLTKFRPRAPSEDFLQRYALRDKFVCSYVGTIGMAHGLDVVLRAAQILKQKGRTDIVFCLVGEGARKARLQTMAQHLGVEPWIRFTGLLPNSDMPSVLASSDVLLVHLRACELFQTVIPSKIFETMAMERPIIMGVSGEAYEIVDHAHAGIPMKPDSESDLVRIVELLADDPELARELSESGRRYVSEHYNRDRLAARYLEILARVAGQPLPVAPALPQPASGEGVTQAPASGRE
jgi:glycosyltransferase involved in cell wall biosynthesis